MSLYETLYPNYYNILKNKQQAKYLLAKHIPVVYNKHDSLEKLWHIHDTTLCKKQIQESIQHPNLLDLKQTIAKKIYNTCHFCPHHCRVNRNTSTGRCGVQKSTIASEFIHYGEEPLLVPSYTIFFSGCTMNCVFCQNWDISQSNNGIQVSPTVLSQLLEKRTTQHIKTINWVGGDPTPHLYFIIQVLQHTTVNIPQIWNSNMYCSNQTIKLLQGIIDVYLTDYKFGNNTCAERLGKVKNYCSIIQENHKWASTQGELLIRHLVLPTHSTCCSLPILEWIKEHVPQAGINIMQQYRPTYQAVNYQDINQPLTEEEFDKVLQKAQSLHLNLL